MPNAKYKQKQMENMKTVELKAEYKLILWSANDHGSWMKPRLSKN